jgi:PAS domain S-box-containing protein
MGPSSKTQHDTEIGRLSRLYDALRLINRTIVRVGTRDELFAEVCREVVEHGGFLVAWIGWEDRESRRLVPVASWGDKDNYLRDIVIYTDDRPEGQGPTGTAFREQRPYICNDLDADAGTLPWRAKAKRMGFGSSAALPIRLRGEVCGTLSVYAAEPGYFTTREIVLLEEAASDVSFALDRYALELEHRHADAVARQEKHFSDTMIESMPGIVYFYDVEGKFLRWNQNMVIASGYSPEEIAGMHPVDFFAGSDQALIREKITEVFACGESNVEATFVAKDGRATPYFFTGRRLIFNGKPCLVGVGVDVAERHKVEAALRSSEERYRTTLDGILEGCQLIGVDWRYLYLNDTAELHNRRPNRELLGRTMQEAWPGIEAAPVFQMLRRCMDERCALHNEIEYLFADGSRGWFDVRCQPVAEGIFVLSIDISDRRQAEAALRESEERFRQFAENIDEVFWMTDFRTGRLLYVSPAFEQIWGRRSAELYASPSLWADAIRPEDRERVKAAIATQVSGEYRVEYRIARPDGEERWIFDRAFPIRDAAGAIYRIAGIAQDITARKKLEEQFLRVQRMEAIGALAGGVAHDLNNILAPVLMVAGLLKSRNPSPQDLKALNLVESSAQRGAAIIRQLLMFSRGAAGERLLVQVRHLIKEMTDLMQETFPRGIVIGGNVAAELWVVMGDPTQLHQVLLNLCVNARDAMPAGGRLEINARNQVLAADQRDLHPDARAGNYVVISVTDTGHGIPAAVIDRIFEPFFTTKEIGKGTGLGLSTVLGIVKGHGGFVTVDSILSRGTTFNVHLPAVSAEQEEHTPEAEVIPLGRNELVLVVDDEPNIGTTTRLTLEAHHYRVLLAANGQEAVSHFLAHQGAIRLVLTDVMMPVMDGLELVRALRSLQPSLKVIATTGLDQDVRQAELNELGVTSILLKPFTPQKLLTEIRRTLDEVAP